MIAWSRKLWRSSYKKVLGNLGLGGDYMIPVGRDEILSGFAGIPPVL